jgi:hypothetical protein
MRKFTLLLTLLLAFMTTAIAQIDTSKEYRVKHTTTGKVMNASNYDAHPTGPLGGVNFVEEAESDDQVFLFEADGTGYKLKTKSGKYIYCQAWNVDALDQASTLTFSNNGDGTYKIGCDKGYFKVENVTGSPVVKENGVEVTKEQVSGYFPFCDAGYTAAANFELVEVEAGTPEVPEVPEVGGEDEATLAAIEKAEAVLAKTGVGYPATESASRAALVAAVEEARVDVHQYRGDPEEHECTGPVAHDEMSDTEYVEESEDQTCDQCNLSVLTHLRSSLDGQHTLPYRCTTNDAESGIRLQFRSTFKAFVTDVSALIVESKSCIAVTATEGTEIHLFGNLPSTFGTNQRH